MKWLTAGNEPKERLDHIIGFTRITEKKLIAAIVSHLDNGIKIGHAATINGIDQQHLSRAIKTLNEKSKQLDDYKAYEWEKFKNE